MNIKDFWVKFFGYKEGDQVKYLKESKVSVIINYKLERKEFIIPIGTIGKIVNGPHQLGSDFYYSIDIKIPHYPRLIVWDFICDSDFEFFEDKREVK